MEIIALSTSRNILRAGSADRMRMELYAAQLASYSVIVLTRKGVHGDIDDIHSGNLHIYPTCSRSRWTMLFDAFLIGRRLARASQGIPIISAQDPLEIGWTAFCIAWRTGARLHIQVHGDYCSTEAWVGKSIVRKIRRACALRLLRRVQSIRVVSERIATSLVARGVPRSAITVLPIRPQLERFLAQPAERASSPSVTFLSLGRLAPEKNISRIVYAFALVRHTHPDARLRIVGSGPCEAHVRQLVHELNLGNAVTFCAWTDDVPGNMSRADVFVLASHHEAYALTLIEAAAAGLAMVTTDVGCVGEVVYDGVHGTVVTDGTIEAYAEAMRRMCRDTVYRAQCGRNGRMLGEKLAKITEEMYIEQWVGAHTTSTPIV